MFLNIRIFCYLKIPEGKRKKINKKETLSFNYLLVHIVSIFMITVFSCFVNSFFFVGLGCYLFSSGELYAGGELKQQSCQIVWWLGGDIASSTSIMAVRMQLVSNKRLESDNTRQQSESFLHNNIVFSPHAITFSSHDITFSPHAITFSSHDITKSQFHGCH